ncbi:MAG: N-acetylmuramoyl-L-alanine amidase [Firmicutes bacterium]|nr:N-acetylmuramoyl-L-alanine amidase [Bacillota bacterium]
MIKVIKLKNILICLGAFALIAAVTLSGVAIRTVSLNNVVTPNGKTIVLDAGHGGRDGGVSGPNGLRESEINLNIALATQNLLQKKGYNVVMTRTTSDGLYNHNDQNKKQADMSRRRQIINDAAPDLVISIHQNSFHSSSVRGPRVFYAKGSVAGKASANHIQTTLNKALNHNAPAAAGDYFILEKTQYQSILIECGFLTNPSEAALLATHEHQQRLGQIIFLAIHSLLSNQPPQDVELD